MPVAAALAQTALPVDVADECVEGDDGLAVVIAVGMLHRPAVELGRSLLAMAGEFLGQFRNVLGVDAADLRVFLQGLLKGPLFE